VSGIGKLGINADCKGFGKSAPFQTHSFQNVDNAGYESDFFSRVNLDYDCCEGLDTKVNLSSISMNTSFKHVVSHLGDLKIASHKIAVVEHKNREGEWKRQHTASQGTYSVMVYVCLSLIVFYVVYKLYNCFMGRIHCRKAVTDATGSGNVVNIKIHTSNESLAMAQEDVPLRELSPQNAESKPRRSNRLRSSKSCFQDQ
jgi:hypothetical protein